MAYSSQVKNAGHGRAVIGGSANIFADLGFADDVERQVKLRLAYAVNQVLEARKISQADAAKVLGVTRVSALRLSEQPTSTMTRVVAEKERDKWEVLHVLGLTRSRVEASL